MADPVIVVEGRGDFAQLNRALGQADSSVSSSTSKWKKLGSVVKAGALGAAAGAAAIAAVGFKLAQGAAEDEKAQVRLATALRNTTGARSKEIAGVEAYISAQGKALGVTDDELRPALGQLAAATGSVGKAQKLTSLALNISAGRGLKLASVTKTLERAQLGNVTSLGKLGVETKDAEGKARSLQEITQELARTYRGQASAAANTTAGKYARLKLTLDELGESIGAKLLPLGQKLADTLLKKGVPAAERLWKAFDRNGVDGLARQFDKLTGINLAPYLDDVRRAGENVKRIFEALSPAFGRALESIPPFLQPLQLLADGLGALAGFAESIPEPIKDLGIQAAIAAAILPVLTRNATLAGAAIGTAAGRAALAAGVMTRLAAGARTAAGIGGLLALSQAMKNTGDDAVSFGDAMKQAGLYVGGGAAAGFSIGGPIGALVGALGGAGAALLGLRDKTEETDTSLQNSKQVVADYAGSFDQLTGAITRSTRELVLQEIQKAGIISSANLLGVSTRDLIDATLGQGNAAKRVREQLASYDGVLEGLTANKVREFLVGATGEFSRQQRQAILAADALSTYRERLQGVPRKVVVALRQAGFPEGKRQVDAIIGRYKLTPREIKTVYRALNVNTTKRQAGDLKKTLEGVGKVAPKFNPLIEAITGGTREGARRGRQGGRRITDAIEQETGKARPKFGPFANAVPGALAPARGNASRGGVSIGDALENGVVNGFSGAAIRLSNMAAAAVSQAIAAGKRAGNIKSPSKETEYLGKMLGDGLVLGLRKRQGAARGAGRSVVAALLDGMTGSSGIGRALDKLSQLIDKRTKDARGKVVLKSLRDEYKALRAIGKQQDQNNARLEKAAGNLKSRIADAKSYASTIRESFLSFGSVLGLGAQEDGSVSSSQLIDQLKDRLAIAKRFAALIRSFTDKTGTQLNAATLQQLLDAGPETGIATAEAIAAGGNAAIQQINSLTADLSASGGSLGSAMADRFKGAGIAAAAALVKELEGKQKRLDRIGDRLGDRLVSRVEKLLGIGGPGAGRTPAATPRLAVNDTYARRQTVEVKLSADDFSRLQQGRQLRGSVDLVDGYGKRTLATGARS